MDADEVDTVDIVIPSLKAEAAIQRSLSALVEIDVAGASHCGLVRASNEDHYYVACANRTLETLATNMPDGIIPARHGEKSYGMLVADGIGGAAAGETASRLAVSTLVRLVLATPDWIMRYDEHQAERWTQRFRDRFHQIHHAVMKAAQHDPNLEGMGTTLTLACSNGNNLLIVHIGDSRVYLFRKQVLQKLTVDHTVAQELADTGKIASVGEAPSHLRHTLTRAIGGTGEDAHADVRLLQLENDDRLLLCTDGLSDMVNDAAIAQTLAQHESSASACQALVDLALARGGKDNITLIVTRFHIPDPAS